MFKPASQLALLGLVILALSSCGQSPSLDGEYAAVDSVGIPRSLKISGTTFETAHINPSGNRLEDHKGTFRQDGDRLVLTISQRGPGADVGKGTEDPTINGTDYFLISDGGKTLVLKNTDAPTFQIVFRKKF